MKRAPSPSPDDLQQPPTKRVRAGKRNARKTIRKWTAVLSLSDTQRYPSTESSAADTDVESSSDDGSSVESGEEDEKKDDGARPRDGIRNKSVEDTMAQWGIHPAPWLEHDFASVACTGDVAATINYALSELSGDLDAIKKMVNETVFCSRDVSDRRSMSVLATTIRYTRTFGVTTALAKMGADVQAPIKESDSKAWSNSLAYAVSQQNLPAVEELVRFKPELRDASYLVGGGQHIVEAAVRARPATVLERMLLPPYVGGTPTTVPPDVGTTNIIRLAGLKRRSDAMLVLFKAGYRAHIGSKWEFGNDMADNARSAGSDDAVQTAWKKLAREISNKM